MMPNTQHSWEHEKYINQLLLRTALQDTGRGDRCFKMGFNLAVSIYESGGKLEKMEIEA